MKLRSVLILAGLLAGLCLVYWLVLLGEERSEQRAYDAKRLFDFAPGSLKTVTIQREGERATVGERREQGSWTILQPYQASANSLVWDRVAQNLAELLSERIVHESAPDDLESYGLAKPVLKVNATTDSGEAIAITFGSMEPTQKYRYGLLENGPLFLASTDQFFELDRDFLWLRDRNLINKGDAGISRIEFARMTRADSAPEGVVGPETWKESVTVVAERGEDGVWHILEPEPSVADQDTLNQVASEIQFAVGREYVDEPESYADYQLDPPKARISVFTAAADSKQTFYLGAFSTGQDTEGGVFVKRDDQPSVFVIDAQIVTLLPETPTAWHEKSLVTRGEGSAISSITYTAGEQHFRLATTERQPWRLTEPRDEEVDQGAVSQFISLLLNATGTNYWKESKPEFGLDDPIIRIEIGYGDDREAADIRIGSLTPEGGARYVTQDTGDVTSLPVDAIEQFVVTYTDFAPKGLLQFRESDAKEVSLVFEGVNYRFTRGETAWLVSEPEGKIWESQSDMRALLEGLRTLRSTGVERSTAPPNLVPYGLDDPLVVVGVSTRNTDGKETVYGPVTIGSLCEDRPHERYAMAVGRLDLFRVPQDIIDTVRDVLRGVVDETTP